MKTTLTILLSLVCVSLVSQASTRVVRKSESKVVVIIDGSEASKRIAAQFGNSMVSLDGDFTSILCEDSGYCEISFKIKSIATPDKLESPITDGESEMLPSAGYLRIKENQKVLAGQTYFQTDESSPQAKLYRGLFNDDQSIPDMSGAWNGSDPSAFGTTKMLLPTEGPWNGEAAAGTVVMGCKYSRYLNRSSKEPVGYRCSINVIVDEKFGQVAAERDPIDLNPSSIGSIEHGR